MIILCIILFLASNTAVGCPEHNNRPLEFYDTDDGQPVCSHCVVARERQTHLIVPIDDIVSAVLIQTCSEGSIVWQSCRYGSCHNIFITWQWSARGHLPGTYNFFLGFYSINKSNVVKLLSVLLSTTICIITVVKMLWTHEVDSKF